MKFRIPFLFDWLDRKAEEAEAQAEASRREVWKRLQASLDAAREKVEADRVEADAERDQLIAAREQRYAEAFAKAKKLADESTAPLREAFAVGDRLHFLGVTVVVTRIAAQCDSHQCTGVLTVEWFDNDGHTVAHDYGIDDIPLLQAENARGAA